MFDNLVPMGRMWDSHVTPTDHMYLQVSEQRERGLVKTPAAGTVIRIERFQNDQSPFWDQSEKEPDIRVIIAHSCTLFSIYIHLGELSPKILEVTGDLAPGERWSSSGGREIRLSAGEAVARFGGSSIDYSLHDETVILAGFQVPAHYDGEPWKVHTVDPFDYMSEELAADLRTKNERTVEPLGGQIAYDVPGTLAGNWFMDGTIDYGGGGGTDTQRYWNGHLSIAYDHVDPSQIRVSIGRDVGLTHDDCRVCGGVYAVNGNGPDPATVTVADGIVRYELTGRHHASPDSRERTVSDGNVLGTFLLRVLDGTSIRTEFAKGALASETGEFSSGAVIYRR